MTDQCGRTGSVVANSQFQFDDLVQVDALAADGFSICENNTLSVLGSAVFYQCLNAKTEERSAFNNLYTENQGGQCNASYIQAVFCEVPDDQLEEISNEAACSVTGIQTNTAATPTATGEAEDSGAVAPTTTAAPAPFPAANGTNPIATGSAPPPGATSAPGGDIAPFEGSAATLILGGKVFGVLAGVAAFAML